MHIITGGGTGIGRALALQLAARQQSVLIIGRHGRPLKEVAGHSSLISYLSADVTSKKGRQKIIEHLQTNRALQSLVHCAVLILPIDPVNAIDEIAWKKLLATNLSAPLFLTQLLLDKLQDGRVLQLESDLAERAIQGLSAYCVSKAGLTMLTQCWQKDSPTVAITGANPGIVNTNGHRLILEAEYGDETLRSFLRKVKQNGLLFSPDTVALFLTWLLLDSSKEKYVSQTWDIRDTAHHSEWLVPPHVIPDQKMI